MEARAVGRARWGGRALSGSGRGRWAWSGATTVAFVGLASMLAAAAILHETPGWGYDFEAYYLAAQRWARGDGVYQAFQLSEPFRPGPFGLYLYSPPLALATVPFTVLSLDNAKVPWYVLHVVLLAGACALMPVPRRIRLLMFGVAALSKPAIVDLNLGNVSLIVTFLLAVIWRWLDRPLGSLALALALSIRPTLGVLLVWWLLRRRVWPIVWTVAAALVLVAVTLPFVGVQGYVDFLTVLRNVSHVTGVTNNLDFGSTALRLGLGPVVAQGALFFGYAVALICFLLSLRRDREVSFMVTIGGTLLVAPLLWDHYLTTLILTGGFLAARGRTWGVSLPLVAWMPHELTPLIAMAGAMLPFLARPPTVRTARTGGRPSVLRDPDPALLHRVDHGLGAVVDR